HPRVLYVGSIFTRRHVPDLIRAFAQVARKHADAWLDLVGDDRSFPREDIGAVIARERMEGRIVWHQYVSDDELSGLYASARAFAFLSEYEGLGLTPLEALTCGVPPVLLDTPIARESCGEAALYVPKGDIPSTVGALDQLLFSDTVRQSLLTAAPVVLARYDWPRAARQTLAVLEGAASPLRRLSSSASMPLLIWRVVSLRFTRRLRRSATKSSSSTTRPLMGALRLRGNGRTFA